MSKAKLRAATVGGTPDDIEAAFYDALQIGDITRLMACWADEDDIVCVHPGGARLVGAGAIRAAFEALFANGGIPARPERVRKVASLASAMHNVLERVDVMTQEGPQQACCDRDQRVPQDGARLAAGGAPRQPGLAAGCRRGQRRAAGAALNSRALSTACGPAQEGLWSRIHAQNGHLPASNGLELL